MFLSFKTFFFNSIFSQIGAAPGSGYGAFPGQTFTPGGGGGGGGGGGYQPPGGPGYQPGPGGYEPQPTQFPGAPAQGKGIYGLWMGWICLSSQKLDNRTIQWPEIIQIVVHTKVSLYFLVQI